MPRRRLSDQPHPRDVELRDQLRRNDAEIDDCVARLHDILAIARRRAQR